MSFTLFSLTRGRVAALLELVLGVRFFIFDLLGVYIEVVCIRRLQSDGRLFEAICDDLSQGGFRYDLLLATLLREPLNTFVEPVFVWEYLSQYLHGL
jgi:hypothetical protein